ncbi:hypothetical protein KJ713_01920 [Patescibacteria group bacterium]|nr:hypothetical protein [Patescibacteria group bacterium]
MLKDKEEKIDYKKLIRDYPWIVKKNQDCILSPDSDGLLCGLFVSYYLNWNIKGFYDGKILVIDKDTNVKDCIFLDMEVFRKNIRSIGHHMVLFNLNRLPENWEEFQNCIQPNNLRNYDGYKHFRLKYPLATIHLLIGIIGSKIKINIPESAICPLLFVDGTFNVLFKYPENVLNWLRYLLANEKSNPLKPIFENEKYSVFTLMKAMDDFFRKRDEISIFKERGDRLRISETSGSPANLIKQGQYYDLNLDAQDRIKKFLKLLSDLTGWTYNEKIWSWEEYKLLKFTKKDFSGSKIRLNNATYTDLISKKPLTWAMISGQNIEYTLEYPDKLV